MSEPAPLVFEAPLALVGGAPHPPGAAAEAAALAPHVVAADGGADRLAADPDAPDPEAVIGDMDSLLDPAAWQARLGARFLRVTEQDSTDLEKCLRLTRAPLTIGVGFLGGRADHSLAALHALMTHRGRRIVLLGPQDVVWLCPPVWRGRLAPAARLSVWPMAQVTAVASEGLEWPLRRLPLAPGVKIGTSNRTVAEEVAVEVDAPAAILLTERRFLRAVVESLGTAEVWPVVA